MALQTIIAGPVGTAPTADYTQETITGAPLKAIHLFDHGRYLLRVVTSLGGANAAPPAAAGPLTFTAEQTVAGILSGVQVSPIPVVNGGTGSIVGAPGSHSFGVSGTPALNDVTQAVFTDRAITCDGLTIACGTAPSGGSVTATLQTSTDGTTWTNLTSGAVSATTGTYSGTAACTTAVAANTYIRGKFTAVNGAADVTCILFIRS